MRQQVFVTFAGALSVMDRTPNGIADSPMPGCADATFDITGPKFSDKAKVPVAHDGGEPNTDSGMARLDGESDEESIPGLEACGWREWAPGRFSARTTCANVVSDAILRSPCGHASGLPMCLCVHAHSSLLSVVPFWRKVWHSICFILV